MPGSSIRQEKMQVVSVPSCECHCHSRRGVSHERSFQFPRIASSPSSFAWMRRSKLKSCGRSESCPHFAYLARHACAWSLNMKAWMAGLQLSRETVGPHKPVHVVCIEVSRSSAIGIHVHRPAPCSAPCARSPQTSVFGYHYRMFLYACCSCRHNFRSAWTRGDSRHL